MGQYLIATTPVPKAAGVYVIEDRHQLDQYIGSSCSLITRFKHHEHASYGHWTYRLNDARRRHGKLYFRILELCSPETLRERERFWILTLEPQLNTNRTVQSVLASQPVVEQAREFLKAVNVQLQNA